MTLEYDTKMNKIDEAVFSGNFTYIEYRKNMASSIKPYFYNILPRQIKKNIASSMKPCFTVFYLDIFRKNHGFIDEATFLMNSA